jgi:rhodanese-related sulfurtransferase
MEPPPYILIEPEEAQKALTTQSEAQFIDVREISETDTLRVEGVMNIPLSRFNELAVRLNPARPVYLLCRSGSRAATAAVRLSALGLRDIRVVRGGLEAWAACGNPIARGTSRVWSLERQVRCAAGGLVVLGISLGFLVHPGFHALAGFVGAGLVFSAVTDTCTMALILARMPWNQGGGSCGR